VGEVSKGFKEDRQAKANLIEIAGKIERIENNAQEKEYLLALATFYCQGYDIPWEKLFANQKPGKLHLPAYPFDQREYWITSNDNHDRNMQWFFAKEEMVASGIHSEIDWSVRLSRFTGKRICIIYAENDEKENLLNLLHRLQKAANLQGPLAIETLSVQQVNVNTIRDVRPDVVLFLASEKANADFLQQDGSAISYIFRLSKCLMEVAWDSPVHIYYLLATSDAVPQLESKALTGFFRSAMKENNLHVWKYISIHNEDDIFTRFQLFVKEWLAGELPGSQAAVFTEVHYKNGQRYLNELVETTLPQSANTAFRRKGNYIVAGGLGAIGGALLQELAKKYQANLFIISKGAYSETRKEQCKELERSGARVFYYTGDVTDLIALREIYKQIKQEAGEIHGVINLVRAHDSKSIVTKSWESFCHISEVKIKSTLHLDLVTENDHLDLFMLFASIGAYGARGDSDYAFSVAYQNAFCQYRNQLQSAGKRNGNAVSLCWGPWEEDRLFPGSREKMRSLGFDLINMAAAFRWIEAACAYEGSVIGLWTVCDRSKINNVLGIKGPSESNAKHEATGKFESLIEKWEKEKLHGRSVAIEEIRNVISVEEMKNISAGLVERIYSLTCVNTAMNGNGHASSQNKHDSNDQVVETGLMEILQIIRESVIQLLQLDHLDNDKPLQDYGLDSIIAMRLSTQLHKKLKRAVSPNLFLDFPTVKELSQYLNNTTEDVPI
jgi:acyl carrier protein